MRTRPESLSVPITADPREAYRCKVIDRGSVMRPSRTLLVDARADGQAYHSRDRTITIDLAQN